MQQSVVGTDTFSTGLAIVGDIDGSPPLVLPGEDASGNDDVSVDAAMGGAGKNIDRGVSLASLEGDGDREEGAEEVCEMFIPFVSEGIPEEELEDAFEKVGRRGADREPKQVPVLKRSIAYEKEKLAVHSVSQRLIREAEVHLPAYKPKQYSTFAEFRKALRRKEPHSVSVLGAVGTQNTGIAECSVGELTSTLSSDVIRPPATGILKLRSGLSPPRLLEANDDDVIDLLEDGSPVKPAKRTHLNQLLSRFIDSVKATGSSKKARLQKDVKYSIITKVPDAQTGKFSLQLDNVSYKPNNLNALTFTDRRMWARHRLELQAVMRSKRLRHYDERMQHYESAQISSKKADNDSNEADWLEWGESDISTETEQEEDEDVSEVEGDDGDEVSDMSRIQTEVNPFVDDEAEENDDSEHCVDDARNSQLSVAEISESLSSNSSGVVKAYQGLASRACIELGEVDLFATDTTLPTKTRKAHHENPIPCDASSAKILSGSWNGTPYSMLFSQKQVPLQDVGIPEYSSIENNKSDENISNSTPSQAQICQDSTQPTFPAGIINEDPDKTISLQPGATEQLITDTEISCLTQTQVLSGSEKDSLSWKFPSHVDPLVVKAGKPKLMRVRESHEFEVLNAFPAQASLCTLGFGQSPQGASNISLFSSYDSQPNYSPGVQTTQANAELFATTDTEFSAEAVGTHSKVKPQEGSESRGCLKHLHNSDGNLDDDTHFERASKRRALVSEQAQGIKGNGEMKNLPNKSQAKSLNIANSTTILTAAGGEDEEVEACDCNNSSDIEVVDGGTEHSSNDEIEFSHISEQGIRPKYMPRDFIDEEAELSGDEAERAIYMDEEEDIDDDDSDSHSLKEFVDESETDDQTGRLRREVERVYNRIQDDDDQRRIRYLKEMFLEDGDLYEEDGRVRQRRFRWRGLENEDSSSAKGIESDDGDEEAEEEGRVGGAGISSAFVSHGVGVMSRRLLQGSSGSLSGNVPTTEISFVNGKDAGTLGLMFRSIDGASNMKSSGSSASIASTSFERSLSHPHGESQGCSLDLLQRNISGTSTKSSSGSYFFDTKGNSSHGPESLPLTKYGSILTRSATLLPSSSGPRATSPLFTRSHIDKEVEVADSTVSGAGDACGSSDKRAKIFGLGLRSKVDLSCFSMKADSRMVTAPNPISSRTHFIKSTSLQPLERSSICPTNPSPTSSSKSEFKSIFGALI